MNINFYNNYIINNVGCIYIYKLKLLKLLKKSKKRLINMIENIMKILCKN